MYLLMMSTPALFLILVASKMLLSPSSCVVYVALNGSDDNNGTAPTLPVRTVDAARSLARRLRATCNNVTVNLSNGTFFIGAPPPCLGGGLRLKHSLHRSKRHDLFSSVSTGRQLLEARAQWGVELCYAPESPSSVSHRLQWQQPPPRSTLPRSRSRVTRRWWLAVS